MKTEVLSIKEFLHREKEPFSLKIEKHFKKYGLVYRVIGTTVFIFAAGGGLDFAFAADGYTNGIIDKEAEIVYKDLVDIGKWLIIGRGGWEIITKVLSHDVEGAKKNFIGYLLAYVLLLAFPHLMDKVDGIFDRFGA
ncbi:hypothetical protein V7114_20705 [Neobacillus niacini]|uniref:hypothetical protein n=1 Tax=Neobacillus niacini TaxID=86668 RepID=UPI002FFDB0AA